MKSMTGYGKGTVTIGARELTVEIKSVNNRYLEINPRLPKVLSAFDETVKKEIKNCLSRGSVDVFFNYANNGEDEKVVKVDYSLVNGYVAAAAAIANECGVDNDFSVADALKIPDAVKIESKEEDADALAALVKAGVCEACSQLCAMREREGETIKQDLSRLAANIRSQLESVIGRADEVVSDYRTKLRARITELLADVEIDETRLLNEVAFFADKADINEEISRLSSHLEQFDACLDDNDQVGRKLDFLSQEINREINTMGSKANDAFLTDCVLKMKNELEKIKEQIRNVE